MRTASTSSRTVPAAGNGRRAWPYQYRAFDTSPSSRWTIPCIHAARGDGSSCTIACAPSQSPEARSSAARRSDPEELMLGGYWVLHDRAGASSALLQLAVFAASAVVQALMHIEPVRLGLARHAPSDAQQCLAPRFGDRFAAVLAGEEALSLREPAPRPFDRAVDRRVDLILHGAVLGPTDGHGQNIGQERTVSRRMGAAGCSASVGLSRPTAPRSHSRRFEIQSIINAIPRERTLATQTPGPASTPGVHGASARREASLLAQWQ